MHYIAINFRLTQIFREEKRGVVLPSLCQGANDLQDQDTATNATTANLAALLLANTSVIVDGEEFGLNARGAGLLRGHAEVEHVARVVHGNDQHALLVVHAVHGALANLLSRRRGEDGARDGRIKQTVTDIARERRLVTGATARDNGNLRLLDGIRATENDLVVGVKGQRGICQSERVQRGANQMVRVGKEVFGWSATLACALMQIVWGLGFAG